MPRVTISGPDGRNMDFNVPANANPNDVISSINYIQSNWDVLGDETSTAPESNPTVKQGPMRASFLDQSLEPTEGNQYLTQEQKETARANMASMNEDEAALTRRALAENEAKYQSENSSVFDKAAPIYYGATGTISPGLFDKTRAALSAGAYNLSKLRFGENENGGMMPSFSGEPTMGQPYEEALETERLLRDKNWEKNKLTTIASGIATGSRLPTINKFNPNSVRGWVGNLATTGGAYGALHGAGEGETWQDAVLGALKGAGIGTAVGATVGRLTTGLRPQSAQEIQNIKDAELAGVRINKAIASDDPSIQQAAGLMSETPFIGTKIKEGLNTAREDIMSGVNRVAQKYRAEGAAPGKLDPLTADSSLPIGENALQRIKNRITKLDQDEFGPKFLDLESEIGPNATSPMNNTRRVAQEITERDIRAAGTKNAEAVNRVMEAITRPEGMTYKGLMELKTDLGAFLKEDLVSKGGTSQGSFKRLGEAVKKDLQTLVRTYGGPSTLLKFNNLMRESRMMILRRQGLEQIIGKSGKIDPQQLAKDVARWASRQGRNLRKLNLVKDVVGRDTLNDLASVALHESMYSNLKTGEKSITNFQKFWNSLTPEGKNILYGQNPELLRELTALNKTSQNLDEVLKNVNNSKTAYGNFLLYLLDKASHVAQKFGGMLLAGATGAAAVDMGASAATGLVTASSLGVPIALGRLYARGLSQPATIRSLNRTYSALARYIRAPSGRPSAVASTELRDALLDLSFEAAKETGEDPRKVAQEILAAAKIAAE